MKTFNEIKGILIEKLRETAIEESFNKNNSRVMVETEIIEENIIFTARANAIVSSEEIKGDDLTPDDFRYTVSLSNLIIENFTE